MMTCAPVRPKASAIAVPMPRLAPVTRASFPAKGLSVFNIVSVYSGMVEEHEGGGESRLRSTSKVSGSRAIYIPVQRARSEEHTSELQSLMRISYAVFCLKKKKQNKYQE